MQRRGLDEFKVGLFVAVGLGLAMLIIFMIGSEQQFFARQYTLYTNFKSISGLRAGAPVQLAGLKVGFVDDIRFPDDPARKEITVVLRVNKKFQKRIRTDSVASIETQGLLGDKFIYISFGSETQSIIPNKGMVPTQEATSFYELAKKASVIMDNISETSKTVNEMLGSVRGEKSEGDLKAIVSSIRKTLEQAEKGKNIIHALFYDPKGEQVISNLSDTMKTVRDIVAGAEKESKGQMGGLIANLRKASGDLKVILSSVRRGEGTLGKLVMDPSLYDEVRAMFGKANRNRLLRAVIRSTMKENDRRMIK